MSDFEIRSQGNIGHLVMSWLAEDKVRILCKLHLVGEIRCYFADSSQTVSDKSSARLLSGCRNEPLGSLISIAMNHFPVTTACSNIDFGVLSSIFCDPLRMEPKYSKSRILRLDSETMGVAWLSRRLGHI